MASPARAFLVKQVGTARSLSDKGNFSRVAELMSSLKPRIMKEQPSLWGKMRNYYVTAHLNHAKGYRTELEKICDSIEGDGFQLDLKGYTSILTTMGRTGLSGSVLNKTWKRMLDKGIKPDAGAWNALLAASCDDFSQIHRLMNQMKLENVAPDSFTYNILIRSFAKHGYAEEAWRYLENMQRRGLHIDLRTLGPFIKYCADRGYQEWVDTAFKKVRSLNLPVDDLLISSIIQARTACKDLTGAESTFRKMLGEFPEAVHGRSWAALIKAHSKLGRLEDAVSIIGEMARLELRPDYYVYSGLLEGYLAHGKVALAEKLLESMEKDEIKPTAHTMSLLLRGQLRARNISVAMSTKELMLRQRMRIDVRTYHELVAVLGEGENLNAVEEVFEEMRETIGWTPHACRRMVEIYSSRRMGLRMIGMLRRMIEQQVQPDRETHRLLREHFDSTGTGHMYSKKLLTEVGELGKSIAELSSRKVESRKGALTRLPV
ncbi:hypothetical protein NDN08_005145 [Rhodosorus marinus]|uniref:Pentacotripeptide-repeat region of PRORP domain-containing protein n=1 Tax=Rhodosorus marinus TaxID=101924 RepID=A0AAV8V0T8_9RHOD|nr:hypothetical protein NDN08_005145 [Rhodosorus marinus]